MRDVALGEVAGLALQILTLRFSRDQFGSDVGGDREVENEIGAGKREVFVFDSFDKIDEHWLFVFRQLGALVRKIARRVPIGNENVAALERSHELLSRARSIYSVGKRGKIRGCAHKITVLAGEKFADKFAHT